MKKNVAIVNVASFGTTFRWLSRKKIAGQAAGVIIALLSNLKVVKYVT